MNFATVKDNQRFFSISSKQVSIGLSDTYSGAYLRRGHLAMLPHPGRTASKVYCNIYVLHLFLHQNIEIKYNH